MVAITTGEVPKIVFAHSGNRAKQSATSITPIPSATESPTIAVKGGSVSADNSNQDRRQLAEALCEIVKKDDYDKGEDS